MLYRTTLVFILIGITGPLLARPIIGSYECRTDGTNLTTEIEFLKDGTYRAKTMGMNISGRYRLSGSTITIWVANKRTDYQIVEFTKDGHRTKRKSDGQRETCTKSSGTPSVPEGVILPENTTIAFLNAQKTRARISYPTQVFYEGTVLKNGIPNGSGKYTFPDGSTIEARFEYGRPAEGKGYLEDGTLAWSFSIADLQNSTGSVEFASGIQFIGELTPDRGLPDGQGTMKWPNGNYYIGQARNTFPHGQGAFYFPDGTKYQEGLFQNGYLKRGTVFYSDGETAQYLLTNTNPYRGTLQFSSGFRYSGEVDTANCTAEGYGTLQYPDGRRYEGQFRGNQMHGQGTMYGPNGKTIHSGRYENGEPANQ